MLQIFDRAFKQDGLYRLSLEEHVDVFCDRSCALLEPPRRIETQPEAVEPLCLSLVADFVFAKMLCNIKPPQRIDEPCLSDCEALEPPQLSQVASPRKPDDQLSEHADDLPSFEPVSWPPSPDVAQVLKEWESQKAKSARNSFYNWQVDESMPEDICCPPDRIMHELHARELNGFLQDVSKRPHLLKLQINAKRCRQERKQQSASAKGAHSWPVSVKDVLKNRNTR